MLRCELGIFITLQLLAQFCPSTQFSITMPHNMRIAIHFFSKFSIHFDILTSFSFTNGTFRGAVKGSLVVPFSLDI